MPHGDKGFQNKISNKILNQDLFGHRIFLNFNEKGQEHHTVLGGLFSIILKILVFIYI